ncbi:MAG: iron-sulfur cluster insertion protein ErpA [Pseudomonadota bacterium]
MGLRTPPAPFQVSDRAIARVRDILDAEGNAELQLRVSVSGGGCSGFQYGFDLDAEHLPDDVAVERSGVRVVVDGMSLMYLIGAELDFVEDLTGSYFRMQNPNASASCGCGNSFAI